MIIYHVEPYGWLRTRKGNSNVTRRKVYGRLEEFHLSIIYRHEIHLAKGKLRLYHGMRSVEQFS